MPDLGGREVVFLTKSRNRLRQRIISRCGRLRHLVRGAEDTGLREDVTRQGFIAWQLIAVWIHEEAVHQNSTLSVDERFTRGQWRSGLDWNQLHTPRAIKCDRGTRPD